MGKRTGIEAALFRNDFEPVEGERLAGGRTKERVERGELRLHPPCLTYRLRLAALFVRESGLPALAGHGALGAPDLRIDFAKGALVHYVLRAAILAIESDRAAADRGAVDLRLLMAVMAVDEPDVVLARATTEPVNPWGDESRGSADWTTLSNQRLPSSIAAIACYIASADRAASSTCQFAEGSRKLRRIRKVKPDPEIPWTAGPVASPVCTCSTLNGRCVADPIKNPGTLACDLAGQIPQSLVGPGPDRDGVRVTCILRFAHEAHAELTRACVIRRNFEVGGGNARADCILVVRLALDLRVEGTVATENNHCPVVYVLTTSRHAPTISCDSLARKPERACHVAGRQNWDRARALLCAPSSASSTL